MGRPLIRVGPDTPWVEVLFEGIFLVMFTLIAFVISCGLVALIVFALYSIVEGAVT